MGGVAGNTKFRFAIKSMKGSIDFRAIDCALSPL
jgi:hypothetical protein